LEDTHKETEREKLYMKNSGRMRLVASEYSFEFQSLRMTVDRLHGKKAV
jgi:hypothetical protein